ncbi:MULTISPECIES: TetR/AcrR family transcriptional regulator [Geobacter]|uniref:TetR/AcrR family transcriptional regulator n=1 Tax=Geobacter TaxID=28231 RepID=UPI0025735B74|nr:TetR/AcrR family transcriptional regulator [Geobacter sulfurreducens]BEH11044.1 TetR/AcrR family transcriptional regulator [Geobacter sulfurreducens subsp. ethanolicus]BET58893.1 TetR/AcrR family transcriptional regulator [Geobacter sp. 60473]
MIPKKSTRIRKEEIVQASLRVIGERGANAMTTAAIAEAAGMSESNIYRHFGGKLEINLALTDFIGGSLAGRAATIAAGSQRPVEKLHQIFTGHFALIAENPGIPRFIFSEEVHLGDRRLAGKMAIWIGSYLETLAGVIAAGIAEGEFRQGISPRETAMTFLGMISFTAIRWSMSGFAFDIRDEAARLWDNFAELLR